jgi:predicted nucleotidyltransferase/predicted DNA-binding transcriptional regulator
MVLDTLLGSKGKVALLSTLLDGKQRKVHIRELARNSGLSAPSLMREAKSLVKIGLLREERDGNRVDYLANVDSPLYAPLSELIGKTTGPEGALKESFADSDNDVVFIYGSRAKGNERADSDYDVFVIGREGLRKISARTGAVAAKVGVEVNPYVIAPDEFRRRVSAGDHFLGEVMASPKIFLKGDENELTRLA